MYQGTARGNEETIWSKICLWLYGVFRLVAYTANKQTSLYSQNVLKAPRGMETGCF